MIDNDSFSNDNGNGKVTIAIINQKIEMILKQQELLSTKLEHSIEQSNDAYKTVALLEQIVNRHDKKVDELDCSIDKLKSKSDRQDGLVGVLAVLGSVIASLIGINR